LRPGWTSFTFSLLFGSTSEHKSAGEQEDKNLSKSRSIHQKVEHINSNSKGKY